MYDAGKIIVGLIIFAGIFTSPFWYDLSSSNALTQPDLILPQKENEKECVASKEFMRTEHMFLLNDWRNDVVRKGESIFVSNTGRSFDMSLDQTCLKCHSNTSQFCDQCHNYLGEKPYCWDCHVEVHKPESKR